MIRYIAPSIAVALLVSKLVLGLLCLMIPNATINFFVMIPSCTTTTTMTKNDEEHSPMEKILVQLIGSILLAYALSSFTYLFVGRTKTKQTTSVSSSSSSSSTDQAVVTNNNNNNNNNNDNNNNIYNEGTNMNINGGTTDQEDSNHHRVTLISSIYLGMSILLWAIFQISTYTRRGANDDSDDSDDSDDGNIPGQNIDAMNDVNCGNDSYENAFMNLMDIAAMFIIFSLLGLIASFYPVDKVNDDDEDDNDEGGNYARDQRSKFCCWYTKRGAFVNNNNNNNNFDIDENNGIDTSPLLSQDDNFDTNGVVESITNEENQTDQLEEEQQQIDDQQQDQQSPTIGGRLTGSRRVLKAAGPHTLYLFLGCIVLLIRLPFSLSIPHFVSETLVSLARSEWDTAKTSILFIFIFGTIDAALDFFCVFLFGISTLKIARGVRIDLFVAIMRQEIAFFDTNKSGDLASRLNSDCGEMASDLTWFFRFSIESVVRISGVIIYMFFRSPKLALCAVSVVPIVALVNKRYTDWLSKNARDVQTALAAANSVAQEALLCIRTVIAFASEQDEQEKYNCKVDEHYRLNVKQLYATGFYYMFISTFLINTCIQALLLYVGMLLIRSDRMSADVLLAFMFYQSQLQNEVMNLFNSYTSLVKSSGAGDKVFELLDRITPPPGTGSCGEGSMEEDGSNDLLSGDIVMSNIRFCYPTRHDEVVLDRLNLEITSGQTIALVGKSGQFVISNQTLLLLLLLLLLHHQGCI